MQSCTEPFGSLLSDSLKSPIRIVLERQAGGTKADHSSIVSIPPQLPPKWLSAVSSETGLAANRWSMRIMKSLKWVVLAFCQHPRIVCLRHAARAHVVVMD